MTAVDGSRGIPPDPGVKPVVAAKPVTGTVPAPLPGKEHDQGPPPPDDKVKIGDTAKHIQASGSGPTTVEAEIPPLDKARINQAVNGVKMLMGYSRTDWEITAPAVVEAVNNLVSLPEPEFQQAVHRLKTEDGGKFYQRLKEHLPGEHLGAVLAAREQASALPPGPAQQEGRMMLAATVAAAHIRAMCVADYEQLEFTSQWVKPLKNVLPPGVRQAIESASRPAGPARKDLREHLEKQGDSDALKQALINDLRLPQDEAQQFIDMLKLQQKYGIRP